MIELGRFQIDLDRRTLQCNGEVVRVGSRAFDILAAVVSADGRLVTKDELMNAVWPDTIVEENNLQVHLSTLRKVLGEDRGMILTVPRRGYQLAKRQPKAALKEPYVPMNGARHLPLLKSGLIGRDAALRQIREMLDRTQVLTLVGAGGIGKTSLAVEVARQLASELAEPVCFVELAALTTKEAVLSAIAEGCGLSLAGPEVSVAQIAAALAGQHGLLLLDNAEQVIDHVAEAVEGLIAKNDAVRVLVTSREPLRIPAEVVFRVAPLDVPLPGSSNSEILARSAVSLFLSQSNSLQGTIRTDNSVIHLVGEICRRLDGIPLAIELAAAQVAALGVEGLYSRLDDRMAILAGGYRTALPRHQTLRATFDWSHAMLDCGPQTLFRRLAMFGGVFTFEAMCAVACDTDLSVEGVIYGISELVAKSLVTVEFDGPVAKYRLPESTRAYALEKLHAEGEGRQIETRHVHHLATRFKAHPAANDRGKLEGSSNLQQTFDDARSVFD